MTLRTGAIAAALALTLTVSGLVSGAHAGEACPGFSDQGVTIIGTVTGHETGAAMLKLDTPECGPITVGIPAQTHAEAAQYFEECPVGAVAMAIGDTIIGILQAEELTCL